MPSLPPSEFDNPLGEGTGAAVLFGATGGVMEAALRTAYELCTGACPQPACLPAFLPARQLATPLTRCPVLAVEHAARSVSHLVCSCFT